ncbi:Mannosyl-oligosaccharide 1,2-alpha-mannosidase IC [Sphaceloma murrayae]|uniref:alpha-1,2-Mannosidase n=1 Tax=Sphaceloma murrayae TaxID=2082308 RepID=A0A2K1R2L0_9PEZI|nr:Mannosyl-oligosaccharide 1,2-alpha-mannosidase IC [Sphaceloma murrayae]
MFAGRHHRLFVISGCFLVSLYFYITRLSNADFNYWTGRIPGTAAFKWKNHPLKYPPVSLTPLPAGPPRELPSVQYKFGKETDAERDLRLIRQDAVKQAFLRAWNSYKSHAWRADELMPVSGKPKHNYGGWGASLVDNLDTLWIMGLKDEYKEAVDAALQIRFDKTSSQEVNVFETTIRYLGGFLAAFDLSGDTRLLDKATELGDMLLVAFDTPNNLPITRWRIADARSHYHQEAYETVLVAEIGSLSMEFTRLSQRTGDSRYFSAIDRVTQVFASQQNDTKLPGLWPIIVNARAANFTEQNSFTLGGMADSVFEYLPKMHALLGGTDSTYQDMYRTFAATALKHNIVRPMLPGDPDVLVSVDIVVKDSGVYVDEQAQHLVCFAGGMFALAGKLLDLPEHVQVGRKLTDGCVWTYNALPTGIMPEIFSVATCPRAKECAWNETRWKEEVIRRRLTDQSIDEAERFIKADRLPKGFTSIRDRRYLLRPEAIESVFVLYRITGDKGLMDKAWGMFENVLKASWTRLANGMVSDVSVTMEEVRVGDVMESFWMAETLKYFYLIFSEPDLISLDDFVFNTEAHAFRRPKSSSVKTST